MGKNESNNWEAARCRLQPSVQLARFPLAFVFILTLAVSIAPAQPLVQLNPVYVDDSTQAAQTLTRVRELTGAGNVSEAVRVLQLLLDEDADRLIRVENEEHLFESVRAAVNRVIASDPNLLDRYRATFESRARNLVEKGSHTQAMEELLLTPSGYEAALRTAQTLIESACFESALQVLAELESHPDRIGPSASPRNTTDAAALIFQLARYLNRDEVWECADRWRRQAGLDSAPHDAIPWPAGATTKALTPLDPLPALNQDGMVTKPLWSAVARPESIIDPADSQLDRPITDPSDADDGDVTTADLNMMPALCSDTVIVSDGSSIRAFDRFTLSPRWTVSPGAGAAPEDPSDALSQREPFGFRNWIQHIEEPTFITASGNLLVACTGREVSGSNGSDQFVTALDADTGRLRWSIRLPSLDPALADSGVKGPAIISENRVIISARKYLPERRLTVLFLVGLDARTGQLVWKHTVGSAGSLPFVNTSSQFDACVEHRGVVYRADDLGVLSAYRVFDGVPLWVRAMPREAMQTLEMARAWEFSSPIIDDTSHSLILLTPDRKEILRFACASGKLLSGRAADDFGSPPPIYLTACGDNLLAVNRSRIAIVNLSRFESDPIRLSPIIGPRGIMGRVVSAADKILVPTTVGITILNPERTSADPERIKLDHPGNLITLESQVIAVDDSRVHSYLIWNVAEKLLRDRMTTDPTDASPAVTLAELCSRAVKEDLILPAVDAAFAAINRDPGRSENIAARKRLFTVLNTIAATSLEPKTSAAQLPTAIPRIEDTALLTQIVDRLGQATRDADDKVAWIFCAGQLAERLADTPKAVALYQSILDEDDLREATWIGLNVQAPAAIESTRRLCAIVKAQGDQAYSAIDQIARRSLDALLGQTAPPSRIQLEFLTQQYPLAAIVPGIWARIAAERIQEQDETGALAALQSGFEAAMRLNSPDPKTLGEIVGELLTRLLAAGHLQTAQSILTRTQSHFPSLVATRLPSLTGQPTRAVVDLSQIASEISSRSTLGRWPTIGGVTGNNAQILPNATLLEPLIADASPAAARFFITRSDNQAAIWCITPGSPTGELRSIWTTSLNSRRATLIRAQADSAYLAYSSVSTRDPDDPPTPHHLGPIEKIQISSDLKAHTAWKTEPLSDVLARLDLPIQDQLTHAQLNLLQNRSTSQRFMTPTEHFVSSDQVLFTMDERTIVAIERSGKAAAFDTLTGELLWTARTGVSRVYDAQLLDGTLVVAGDEEVYSTGRLVLDLRGVVQVINPQTGQRTQRILSLGPALSSGHPRWIRLADRSSIMVGLESAVSRIDLGTGRTLWSAVNKDAMPTTTAWLMGQTLIVQAPDRALWRIDPTTGSMPDEALDGPRTHLDGIKEISVSPVSSSPDDGFAVCTYQGLMVFSNSGQLKGVDALGGFETITPPRLAQGKALTIETLSQGQNPEGMMNYNLYVFDTHGARIVETTPISLGARPTNLMLMDGRVAISAGDVTVVIHAPEK